MTIKNSFTAYAWLAFLLFTGGAGNAYSAVRIFACEPEWAALAEEIGGQQVQVYTATTAFQDPHHIEARPSLIAKARRARMLLCTGAALEVGWLPLLLRQSGNAAIQAGQLGHFMAAEEVARLAVLPRTDRSAGDVHAEGNPHVHLDPYRLLVIAEALAERLSAVDPSHAAYYRLNLANFSKRWKSEIRRWEEMANAIKGHHVVVQHSNFAYLLDWLGVNVVADLEPKPGLPPTSAHLVKVLARVKAQQPKAVLLASYHDDKPARWLADRSDLPILRLSYTVGGDAFTTDLFSLFETTVSSLLAALSLEEGAQEKPLRGEPVDL